MALAQGIPIRSARTASRGSRAADEGLLLVAHGSECVRSAAETRDLTDRVAAALPGVAVEVGYLEMSDPAAGHQADHLVAGGCRRVVVLPLVLLDAGHAKSDVPAVVVEARERHPQVEFPFGRPIGVTRAPVELLGQAVRAAGGSGLPLLVIARGTSDPDANSEAYKAARLIAEWTAAPFVHVGFSGVTGPSVRQAADVFGQLGYPRMIVVWWYLCHGKLIEQGRQDLAAFAAGTGVEVIDAGHLGPQPALVAVVTERYHEALAGRVEVNCDTCAYRAPWPGREGRVGQAIGVGHSHLAVAHRHSSRGPGQTVPGGPETPGWPPSNPAPTQT
jgi:sirohydrochlorin cobaltochelatase